MLGVDDRNIESATEEISFKAEGYDEVNGSRATADMRVLNERYSRT